MSPLGKHLGELQNLQNSPANSSILGSHALGLVPYDASPARAKVVLIIFRPIGGGRGKQNKEPTKGELIET